MTLVKNFAVNPRPASAATGWSYVAGTSEVGSSTVVTGASDGPVLSDGTIVSSYMRRTVTTVKSSGASGWSYGGVAGAPAAGVAGDAWAGSVYIRSSVASSTNFRVSVRSGTTGAGSHDLGVVTLPAGVWVRLQDVMPAAAGSYDNAYLWAFQSGITQPLSTLDVCCAQAELAASVHDYVDGAIPDTDRFRYDWAGTANASASTRAEWVATTLVSAGSPNPVQLVLLAQAAGTAFTVTGTTLDGQTWPVPGGSSVTTGEQVVLVDNRAPLNTPIRYVMLIDGQARVSANITVPYDGQYLLQSLDGRSRVGFVWGDNTLPVDLSLRSVAFDVPNRRRPPVRFATGGDGGGIIEIRTDAANSATLTDVLRSGKPLVVRTDGAVHDWPAVEIIQPLRAGHRLWGAIGIDGNGTDRVWSIPFLFVDDPEPSTPLVAWTWDDFDDAMATRTWDEFDALFAASTWDDFDTYDWGQL